ncbi:hypothetical protein XM47_14085 [Catenovulum maritimum]|uniref:Cytochrome c domain-containing protein n=2 Tax=Catenovulum maritimum TaxID=1513271 RepID=A0A0J8JJ62_9ALTE|nr:hypothetical protein XM47_14085 [Catenovulum maritimum]
MLMRADYVLDNKNTDIVVGIERGQQLFKLCSGCHQINNQTAPNLQGVVNRAIATEQFDYSKAMQAQQTGVWTVEKLDEFLTSPNKSIPGNKMGFTGIINQADRQALIEYLQTLK